MIAVATAITLSMLAVSMLLAGYRLARGPDAADRILALDTLYINTLAFLVVLGIRYDDTVYFESALVIALLGFVGTVSLAKYLLRGDIVD